MELKLDPPEFPFIDILKPLKDLITWVIEQLISMVTTIVGFLKEHVIAPIVAGFTWIVSKLNEFFMGVVNGIINFLKSNTPRSPEEALELGIKLLGITAIGTVTIGSFLSALNIKVLATGLDIEPFTKFLNELIPTRLVTTAVIGGFLYAGLREPIGYLANFIFRPSLPSPKEAYSMWVKGIIDEGTLNYVFRYKGGFSERWIEAWKKELTYTPSPYEIFRLADYVSLDPLWIAKKLSDVGMEEWDKTKFMEAILKRPLREEVSGLTTEIGTQFIHGWLALADVRKHLVEIGIKPEEIELIIPRIVWVRKRLLLEQRIDIFTEQFRKDLIDKATFETKLKELGLAEENVNLIVALELAKKGILA